MSWGDGEGRVVDNFESPTWWPEAQEAAEEN